MGASVDPWLLMLTHSPQCLFMVTDVDPWPSKHYSQTTSVAQPVYNWVGNSFVVYTHVVTQH